MISSAIGSSIRQCMYWSRPIFWVEVIASVAQAKRHRWQASRQQFIRWVDHIAVNCQPIIGARDLPIGINVTISPPQGLLYGRKA
jgi:hypothetical protein